MVKMILFAIVAILALVLTACSQQVVYVPVPCESGQLDAAGNCIVVTPTPDPGLGSGPEPENPTGDVGLDIFDDEDKVDPPVLPN